MGKGGLALMVAAKAIIDDCYSGLCNDVGDDHLGLATF